LRRRPSLCAAGPTHSLSCHFWTRSTAANILTLPSISRAAVTTFRSSNLPRRAETQGGRSVRLVLWAN
jgi:hypothetical protein